MTNRRRDSGWADIYRFALRAARARAYADPPAAGRCYWPRASHGRTHGQGHAKLLGRPCGAAALAQDPSLFGP